MEDTTHLLPHLLTGEKTNLFSKRIYYAIYLNFQKIVLEVIQTLLVPQFSSFHNFPIFLLWRKKTKIRLLSNFPIFLSWPKKRTFVFSQLSDFFYHGAKNKIRRLSNFLIFYRAPSNCKQQRHEPNVMILFASRG